MLFLIQLGVVLSIYFVNVLLVGSRLDISPSSCALHPMEFPTQQISNDSDDEEESVPVTSLACQWKCPKKRKESTMQISEVNFEKHVYGRTSKKVMKTLEEFDPRPEKYRGTAKENLKPSYFKVFVTRGYVYPCY